MHYGRSHDACDSPGSPHETAGEEEALEAPQLGIPEMTVLGAVPTTPTLSADGDDHGSSATSARRAANESLASRVARQQQPLMRLVQSSAGQMSSAAGTNLGGAANSLDAVDAALSRWVSQLGAADVQFPVQPHPHPRIRSVLADLTKSAYNDASTAASNAAVNAAADALIELAARRTDDAGECMSSDELLRSLVVSLCATAAYPPPSQHQQPTSSAGGSVAPQPLTAFASPVPPAVWKAHAATRQVVARQTIRELQQASKQGRGEAVSLYQATTPSVPSASLAGSAAKSYQRPLASLPDDDTTTMLPEGFVGFKDVARDYASPPVQGMTFGPLAGTSAGMSCGSSVASLKVQAPQHTMTAAVGEEMDDGTVDVNQYVLLQLLGRGRQGEVFLAMDSELHELRAMKVMRRPRVKKATSASVTSAIGVQPTALCSAVGGGSTGAPLALARDRARQQLEREISIMKKCRHRNVVTLYEVIDDPDQDCMYLVMQYVEHGTIVNLGPDGVPDRTVAPCLLAHYARQLCAGLQYLHKHGVIHRDIKPDNILLGPQDTVYLADFGMADAFDDDGDEAHAVRGTRGTVAFMAPELVDATASTTATGEGVDVWALGVTLYTLLYGRLPWDLNTGAMDVMQQITSKPIDFPDLADSVPLPPPTHSVAPDSADDLSGDESRGNRSSAFATSSEATPFLKEEPSSGLSSVQSAVITQGWPRLLEAMLSRDPSQRLPLRSVRRRVIELDCAFAKYRQAHHAPGEASDEPPAVITTVKRSTFRRGPAAPQTAE